MIHQHIYASPRPGMTEEDFQNYWLNVHAVEYASKIKQIKKYLVCTRVPCQGVTDPHVWSGCAEIWIENEAEQLASLQSEEFLEGARIDEPRWAAFWNTMVLDTDAKNSVLPKNYKTDVPSFKLTFILKRKPCLNLESFRHQWLQYHPLLIKEIPSILGYQQCTTRDGGYSLGEARFDAIQHMWFGSVKDIEEAIKTSEYVHAISHLSQIVETRYLYSTAMKENWIIA